MLWYVKAAHISEKGNGPYSLSFFSKDDVVHSHIFFQVLTIFKALLSTSLSLDDLFYEVAIKVMIDIHIPIFFGFLAFSEQRVDNNGQG